MSIGAIVDIHVLLIFSSTKCTLIDEKMHHVNAFASYSWAPNLYKD